MNNNISKCLASVLLCASVVPGTASADEDDVFSLTTSANWQYVDNVFYLPDGNEPTSFGPNTPRGDHSTTLSAGIVGEKRLGRQVLTANTTFNRTRYNDISLLDNDGYNLAAGWRWAVGSDLSGNLNYTKRRYLLGFGDFRLVEPTKNLVDAESWRFDGAYKLDAYWALFGSLNRDTQRNDAAVRRPNDYDIDRIEAGARYTTRGGTAFELLGRESRGDFPNRTATVFRDSAYKQKDAEFRVRWQPVGHSKLSASVGVSKREHERATTRDYDDLYGKFSWEWRPTGHLGLTFDAQRQISGLDDNFTTYFETETFSLTPVWYVTGKLRVDGLVQYRSRDGQGRGNVDFIDPVLLALLGDRAAQRTEDLYTYSVGATWSIQRNLSASAQWRHDRRDSNINFYQYRTDSLSMSLQYLF